jgi:hypothetical protein
VIFGYVSCNPTLHSTRYRDTGCHVSFRVSGKSTNRCGLFFGCEVFQHTESTGINAGHNSARLLGARSGDDIADSGTILSTWDGTTLMLLVDFSMGNAIILLNILDS